MAHIGMANITVNGTALGGHLSITDLGGETYDPADTVEVFGCTYGCSVGDEAHSGRSTTHRTHEPTRLRIRLEGSLPLIAQATAENHVVEMTLNQYDTNPEDGTTRKMFEKVGTNGRFISYSVVDPDTLSEEGSRVPYVDIAIRFETVRFVSPVASTEFEDRSKAQI